MLGSEGSCSKVLEPPIFQESPRQSPIRLSKDVASAPKPAVMESPIAPTTRMSLGRKACTEEGLEGEDVTLQLKATEMGSTSTEASDDPKVSTRVWTLRMKSAGAEDATGK